MRKNHSLVIKLKPFGFKQRRKWTEKNSNFSLKAAESSFLFCYCTVWYYQRGRRNTTNLGSAEVESQGPGSVEGIEPQAQHV